MTTLASISSKGQLVIPSDLRKKFKLKAGTKVRIESRDNQIIITANPPDPYDVLISLRGALSHIEDDIEGLWREEKREEREREDSK